MSIKESQPKKRCFVVGPIGATGSSQRVHADWLLAEIIEPVVKEFPEFETKRADQFDTPGMIDTQVIDALLNAELVIADLSLLNPNAFYEIGLRHMAQLPIIHMQLESENIPFDLSIYRAIKFSLAHPSHLRTARSALLAQVQAILSPDYQVENPVTKTRGRVELQKHATPGQQVIIDRMEAMQEQIDQLQFGIRNVNDLAMRGLGSSPFESFASGAPSQPHSASDHSQQIWTVEVELENKMSRKTMDDLTSALGQFLRLRSMRHDDKMLTIKIFGREFDSKRMRDALRQMIRYRSITMTGPS